MSLSIFDIVPAKPSQSLARLETKLGKDKEKN